MKDYKILYEDTFEQLREQVVINNEYDELIDRHTERVKASDRKEAKLKSTIKALEKKLKHFKDRETPTEEDFWKLTKKYETLNKKYSNAGRKIAYISGICKDFING